jgi:hypothetical protein
MSRTMQIIELIVLEMEKEPDRYRLEVTSRGLIVADCKELYENKREMPLYYTHFYEITEGYQIECDKAFEEFIGGLKA